MERYLGKYSTWLYATLRVVAGLMFALHGTQKLFGWPPGQGGGRPEVGSLIWIGGVIELVTGLLIAIGLFTGWAAFIASGMMAVAYFMAHASGGFLPIVNRGELAVLYCFVFLYIASRGTVACGVDTAIGRPGVRARTS
ncbi:MAG TPA: DoxX family protein [Blastocatellia bacterium]|nr:DoxX family protein [Blastocatellia bacterium]